MSRIKEPLSGGVFSINDPEELQPGQLSEARNAMYLPGPGALQKSRGRQVFATVSATAVDVIGLRDAQYNNGDHYLFMMASGGNIYRAPVGDTGVTALLTAVGGGSTLEAVQYQNRFFLFSGSNTTATASATAVNSNQVIYLSATAAGTTPSVRQHGMLPVMGTPTSSTATGTFSQTTTGYYEYWMTEVAKLTQDGKPFVVEGTFSGNPQTVFVATTATVPVLQMPGVRNAGFTTHWRVYRSAAKASASQKLFPAGYQIAEIAAPTAVSATAQVSIADTTVVTASASALPTQWNQTPALYSDMGAQASALTASDNVYGTMNVPGGSGGKWQAVYGYNFGTFYGNVVGITVELKCYVSAGTAPLPILVTIGPSRVAQNGDYGWNYNGKVPGVPQTNTYHQGVQPQSKGVYVTATAASQTITLGGAADRWVAGNSTLWSSTDFDSNFMVVLYTFLQNTTLAVDYVKVTVTYGGVSDTVIPFPQVVYVFGDTSAQVGKNGPPPTSNTGDMFQDQLVVNDVTSPSTMRYSYPGDPEAFPSTYYVDFQTRENDIVRCIKNVNGRLVVWLDSSTWRMNYLPSERDASFDRGKSTEAISRTYGAVNNMCVCTFSMVDSPELAAFVSNQGIHITDGFSFKTITDGVDWTGTIATRSGSVYTPIALINDRDRHQLLFYFRNDDYDPENYMCLPLCYHQSHLVNGKPKVGGLLHMRNFNIPNAVYGDVKSAWSVPRLDGSQSIYLGYGATVAGAGTATAAGGGKVYIETTAVGIPSQDPKMSFKTRRIYAAGVGNEWEAQEVYGYAPSYDNFPIVRYTPMFTKTNDGGESQGGQKAVTLQGGKMHKVQFRQISEGLRVSASVSASGGYSQEFIIIDGTGFDLEDSGR
jgi:hypothetical protein